jgi:hypothetical protein
MKANHTRPDSGWDLSFWFAVISPLIGILLPVLALAIFVHEPNVNRFHPGDHAVPVRFNRTNHQGGDVREFRGENLKFSESVSGLAVRFRFCRVPWVASALAGKPWSAV